MSYVQDLRTLVGHRPLILVAAGVLILNESGRLLLQHRTDDGLWGIPGGTLELGESTEDAARREVLEETGLVVGKLTLFDVFSGREMFHRYPNGDEVAVVAVVYITSAVRGEMVVRNAESAALQYFSIDGLKDVQLSAPNQPIIRRFLARWEHSAS
jgi:mutator protein MutT